MLCRPCPVASPPGAPLSPLLRVPWALRLCARHGGFLAVSNSVDYRGAQSVLTACWRFCRGPGGQLPECQGMGPACTVQGWSGRGLSPAAILGARSAESASREAGFSGDVERPPYTRVDVTHRVFSSFFRVLYVFFHRRIVCSIINIHRQNLTFVKNIKFPSVIILCILSTASHPAFLQTLNSPHHT